jgi:type IV pilus assembly protein PilN
MRITVNLATRPFIDLAPVLKLLRIAMAVLALVAISLGLGLRAVYQKAQAARATEERLQSQIDAINRERQSYQNMMRQPDNAQLLAQVTALNKLFDEKTFSWTLAMEDLETVLPGGVQVTTLEPVRDEHGTITLHLRVVGPRDRAVELVQNLEHSRYFLLPRIVGESAESAGGANARLEPISASNRVNFDVLADYNSAAPPDLKERKKQEEAKPAADGENSSPPPPFHAAHPLPLPIPVQAPSLEGPPAQRHRHGNHGMGGPQ